MTRSEALRMIRNRRTFALAHQGSRITDDLDEFTVAVGGVVASPSRRRRSPSAGGDRLDHHERAQP